MTLPHTEKSPPLNVLRLRRGSEPVAILSSVLDMQQTGVDYAVFFIPLRALQKVCKSIRNQHQILVWANMAKLQEDRTVPLCLLAL